jgi:type IX secretion system PorP/SprF family membrane protein
LSIALAVLVSGYIIEVYLLFMKPSWTDQVSVRHFHSGNVVVRIWLITLVVVLFTGIVQAQDPIISQFYLSPLQLNPGLSGLTDDPRFTANYRNQFPGFNQAYRTYAISYDQFFPDQKIGLGLWLLGDDAGNGILRTHKAAGIFSYRLELDDNLFLKMGAEIGLVQSTLAWDQLRFGDQIDAYSGTVSPGGTPFPTEEIAPEKNSVIYPDIGLGLVIYGGTYYGGLSARHLNTPDPEFLQMNPALSPGIPIRWAFHGGASWPILAELGRNYVPMNLSPAFIIVGQGPFTQFNGGITFEAGQVAVGAHYRNSDGMSESIIGSIGLRTSSLRIGYSYDVTISGFEDVGGSHEIGFVFVLDDGDQESRYNDCLRIFR